MGGGLLWAALGIATAVALPARAQPPPPDPAPPDPPLGAIPQPPPGYETQPPPGTGLPLPIPEVTPAPSDVIPVPGPVPEPVPSRLEVPAPGTPPGYPVCVEPRDDPAGARARPRDGVPRCRAGFFELAELYTWAAIFGLGTFTWLSYVAGVTGDDAGGLLFGALGLAGGIVGTYALDRIDGGMVPGVPAMISTGLLLGFFEGALVQATFFPEVADGEGGAAVPVLGAWGGATLVGALAFAHEPTVGDALLLRTGALWGTLLGLMMGFAATDLDEDVLGGWLFAGYNFGTLATALLAGSTDVSPARVLWLNVGGTIGILAGALAVGISGDPELRAGHLAVFGVTTLGGLVISWSFSEE